MIVVSKLGSRTGENKACASSPPPPPPPPTKQEKRTINNNGRGLITETLEQVKL